jgi:type III pantothenate kinase
MNGGQDKCRILLVDIGNTNLKWAWLTGDGIGEIKAFSHRDSSWRQLAESCWGDGEAPSRALIASVLGEGAIDSLSGWMQEKWGLTPQPVRPEAERLGVTNAYPRPEQLGVDRWLTLLAVQATRQGLSCIVDCGTAITIDVLDDAGRHRGGLILPGLNLMREALLGRTRIPRVEPVDTKQLLACDTATAVASAGIHSAASLVERVMVETEKECHKLPELILTGSDARAVASVLARPLKIVPDLVMQGLRCLAEEG